MNYEGERKNQKNILQKFADSKIILTFVPHLRTKRLQNMLETTGEMAEWSIAAVLKTVELRGSGGSNPSLSAETKTKDFTKAFKKSFKASYIS